MQRKETHGEIQLLPLIKDHTAREVDQAESPKLPPGVSIRNKSRLLLDALLSSLERAGWR